MSEDTSPILVVPLPGGRVARVPLAELERFVAAGAKLSHTGEEEAAATDPDGDVTAHHLNVDASTGTSTWHTDYEYGPCSYTDESGFPHYGFAWHCHPTGSEYAEVLR